MIDYAFIAIDDSGKATVARIERRQRRLRTAPETVTPAETIPAELPYRHDDGRKGTLRGTVALPAVVLDSEVKRGRDGKPEARPVEDAAKPDPHPWQRLTGPHLEIHPDSVTRYWLVEDRPLDEIRAEVAGEITVAGRKSIVDAIVDGDDPAPYREGLRRILGRIEAAASSKDVYDAGRLPLVAPDAERA